MTSFERWAVWVTSIATTATGLVYVWMKYLLVPETPWAVVNHPLQPLVLKLHIVVAPLLVFAVGLITVRHIWRHLRSAVRLGRRSGVTAALFVGPMVLSGYLIQAITDQGWLRAMAISHIAFGTIYAFGLAVHQAAVKVRGKR